MFVCMHHQVKFNWQYRSVARTHINYGLYYANIYRWTIVFPRESFIFVRSEDLHNNPYKVVGEIWRFLGLSNETSSQAFSRAAQKKALSIEHIHQCWLKPR